MIFYGLIGFCCPLRKLCTRPYRMYVNTRAKPTWLASIEIPNKLSFCNGDHRPHLITSANSRITESSHKRRQHSKTVVPEVVRTNIETSKLDALGEFVCLETNFYTGTQSWQSLFHKVQGNSNFSRQLATIHHQAQQLLQCYTHHSIPVLLSTAPWTLAQKDKAQQQGNHLSAHAFTEFLCKEMTDMGQKGISVVIPYHLVCD